MSDEHPFEVACKLARAFYEPLRPLSWWPKTLQRHRPSPSKPENNLHLNGEGLAGLKRDAVQLALQKSGGSKTKAARLLKIERSTLNGMITRYAGLFLLTCSAFAQPAFPLQATVAAPTNSGIPITLAWDKSPSPEVVGYRIYWWVVASSNANSAAVGNVTNATLTGLKLGQKYYFAATAYDAQGAESPFSNNLGVTATNYNEVRMFAWLGTNAAGPFPTKVKFLDKTNPPGTEFAGKYSIEQTSRLKWE
jgi:hypothetical protein